MRFNSKKYFEEAEKRGISPFLVNFYSATDISVEVFNGEVEIQQIGTSQEISGKGIYDGKLGTFSTDAIDEKTPSLLADNVLESAKYGREMKKETFYAGGKRYRKVKIDPKEFEPATLKDLREFALNLCKKIQAIDKRLTKVFVDVTLHTSNGFKQNSLGLKCSHKSFGYYGNFSVVAENEEKEPRTNGWSFHSFKNLEDLEKEAEKGFDRGLSGALDFFGSKAVASKAYKVVLSPDCVMSLLPYYLSQFNAKSVQKHLSVFEGKVGQKIASSCLTLVNTPFVAAPSSSSYDTDGHPTEEFTLLSRGVLKTYFYSVETALEEKRESNGCACGSGNGSYITLTVKPGKYSQEDLFKKMKDGLYLTGVSGLNSGINGRTLDFSLPCQGYVVRDGKKAEAFSMTVVAGNLKDLFSSVVALADDTDYGDGIFTPSMLVKKLFVSGK